MIQVMRQMPNRNLMNLSLAKIRKKAAVARAIAKAKAKKLQQEGNDKS